MSGNYRKSATLSIHELDPDIGTELKKIGFVSRDLWDTYILDHDQPYFLAHSVELCSCPGYRRKMADFMIMCSRRCNSSPGLIECINGKLLTARVNEDLITVAEITEWGGEQPFSCLLVWLALLNGLETSWRSLPPPTS